MVSLSVASQVRPVGSSSLAPEAIQLGATLLVIDPGVPDYADLMAAALPGTEVYLLDDQADGIEQVTDILAGRRGIHSLHILCHGSPNCLHFSGGAVGLHNINAYAQLLQAWRMALTPESSILLYGCNVAAVDTDEIPSLIAYIAEQTGVSVAASARPKGSTALGGDWVLEVSTGPITACPALRSLSLATYQHLLALNFFQLSNLPLPNQGSSPYNLTDINGTLYFRADDGINGTELWKSDGTEAGTVLVKDINPGSGYSDLAYLTNVNSTLFFQAYDPATGHELWKSDGTEAGTVLVKDINPGSGGSSPYSLTNVNGTLYFQAYDPATGHELWKSDGTEAGTVMVKDIVVGGGSSSPYNLTNVNGTLYFSAYDPATGWELWKSDGTEAGTVMVRDIVAGGGYSDLAYLTTVNDTLFFSAYDPTTGWELWKSDGTEAGTVLVKDIYAGIDNSSPQYLTNVNGTLYFSAYDPTTGWELWKSDGTEAGTVMVKDIVAGGGYSNLAYLTNVNDILFFRVYNPTTGWELWKSDGTEVGTVMVKDIVADTGYSDFEYLTNVNGTLYFMGYDPATGYELWKSDGTEAGTVMVKDIVAGSGNSWLDTLINANGTLYFTASTSATGYELWKSDGTEAGTVMVKDINQRDIFFSSPLAIVGGMSYFIGYDPTTGYELWKSDGTTAGTGLVKDILAGADSPSLDNFTSINDTLYFRAYNPTTGYELWKSDGTEAGTVMVKDIYAGSGSSAPQSLTNINGTVFFTANNPATGFELWKSDGTETGTVLVKDIYAGTGGSSPSSLTNVNGTLYFRAYDPTTGYELWKSDGTEAGTVLVKDIVAGTGYSSIAYLTNVNGTLYFQAYDPATGFELWKSDGTEAGTVLVKDIYAGVGNSWLDTLTNVNGTLYFRAYDPATGQELWKSDGTEVGTVMVKDIVVGGVSSSLSNLTNVNGTLFFTANDGINGYELWMSDGTADGTVLARDIYAGSGGANPFSLSAMGTNTLLFFAEDGVNGIELHKLVVNAPPTGTITISGTATQGQILSASNTLADLDRILGPITYQWQADGVDIAGANGATYTLTQAQVGKAITVKASYVDGFGTLESVTSTPTSPVANVNDPLVGTVVIVGSAREGQTLSTFHNLTDLDGLGSITYTWYADGTSTGVTGSTYALTQADVGKVFTVVATYTDGGNQEETVTSDPTSAVLNTNDLPTGSVTITGLAKQGETLAASDNLADIDGLVPGSITYIWYADGMSTGVTGSTYSLTQAQVGKAITVKASYTDGLGTAESVTSTATAAVLNANDLPTGSVIITGLAKQGETLTASNNLADLDGLGTITYTWYADGSSTGVTGSTYALTQTDVGKVFTVKATYTDGGNTAETVTSAPTSVVLNANDLPTGSVTITGLAKQGETLAASDNLADIDGLVPGSITYTWYADGMSTGVTGSTYSLTQTQVGKAITVKASYIDSLGTPESVTSAATSPVANVNDSPVGTVVIVGSAQEGQTLNAFHNLTDLDGLGTITYTWYADGTNTGVTGSTYALTQIDVGKVFTVVATYTDGGNTAETVASAPTSAVLNTNDLPTGSVTITGLAKQGETLTASDNLTDLDGLGPITYTWYADGTNTGVTGSTYALTQIDVGKVFTVVATYTDGGNTAETVASAPTSAVLNTNDLPTGSVTITGLAKQGQILVASNNLTDLDGLGPITYTWYADGPNTGVTGSTYTLTQTDVGKVLTVKATYTDGGNTAETVTSAPTSVVLNTNDLPTGSVTITGLAKQGETLVASDNLADIDGLVPGSIIYTWYADGISTGVTGSTYSLTQAQVGKVITVKASYTDELGTTESFTSAPTSIVANVNDSPAGTVVIVGSAREGQTLSIFHNLTDLDGLGTITYTWYADGTNTGVTGSTYALTQTDVGKVFTVVATYTDGGNTAETVTSDPTMAVVNVNTLPKGSVTITGLAQQGQTLTISDNLVDEDGISSITYAWYANGTSTGITGSTYALTQADVGKVFTAKASYTDGGNTREAVTSDPTSAVLNLNDLPSGAVTLSGEAKQGYVLTANPSTLADVDGLGVFSYQWQQSSGGQWANISGATNAAFTLTSAQVGQSVRVQVSYTDGQNTLEAVFSPPTATPISPFKSASDFTGDGQTDILWRNATLGSTVVWKMDGPTPQTGLKISPDVDGSWRVGAVADFDRNGSPDLLWQHTLTGDPVLWLFDGQAATTGVALPQPGVFWRVAGVADFSRDGEADILWHNAITGENVVWIMNEFQPTGAVHLTTVPNAHWDVKAVGDLSRDGQADILWCNSLTGETVVWLMEGETLVGAATLPTVPVDWELQGAADFTGDTHLDLLWHHQTTGEVVIWAMQGLDPQSAIALASVDPSWEAVL